MARLIDADALANKLIEQFSRKRDMQSEVILNTMLWKLNQAPTAEDEPVVRCKDCKWHQDNATWEDFINHCKWISTETPDDDDFCSCGERKDDD